MPPNRRRCFEGVTHVSFPFFNPSHSYEEKECAQRQTPITSNKRNRTKTKNMVDEHVQDLNLACWKEDGKLICTNLKNDLFLKLILPGAQYVGERWSSGSYEEFACMYEEIYRMLSSTSPAWRQCKSHDDNVDFKLCFKTLASAWARHVWTCEKDEHMLPKNEIKLMLEQQLSPPLQLEPAIVLAKEDLDAQEQPNLSVEQEERRRTPTPPPPPAASPQPCSSSQADENDRIFASLADTPRRRFPPKERLKRNLHLHHQDSIELLIKTDHSSSSSTSFAVESEVVHQPASPEKRPMLRRQQAICADHSYSSAGRSRTRLQVKREMEQETAVTRGGLEVQYVDLTKEEEDEDKEKELDEQELMHNSDSISTGCRKMETEVSYRNARIIRKKTETDEDDLYDQIDHSSAPGFFSSKWEDPVYRAERAERAAARGRGRRGRGGRGGRVIEW
jgi:hypothetical protein